MTDQLYTPTTQCILCCSEKLDLAVPLTATPVADAFIPDEKREEVQPVFPLDLLLCRGCGHLQLSAVIHPDILFRDYLYVTGSSLGLVEHLRGVAENLVVLHGDAKGKLAVDIGSNDGSMLACFQELGMRVLGVDPALELARNATAAGRPTLGDYFTPETASQIRAEQGPASVITANNVFAHSSSLRGMAEGVSLLLDDRGVFEFEVNYVLDILDGFLFDTVYHEHLCYHAVKPLVTFLGEFGLELFHVERIASKGGSIRCFVQKSGGPFPRHASVAELLALEDERQIDQLATYTRFTQQIDQCREAVRQKLMALKLEGASIYGYGASPTGTTLEYHFGLSEFFEGIFDDNPLKHGLFSPGHHLPVYPSEELYTRSPDYIVILAWRYATPILKRHEAFLEQGGQFLVPCPMPQLVTTPASG